MQCIGISELEDSVCGLIYFMTFIFKREKYIKSENTDFRVLCEMHDGNKHII
jgi:hypothetical protein